MGKTDAAYMRAYRARKKLEAVKDPTAVVGSFTGQVTALKARVEELEEEVKRLKQELAKRGARAVAATGRVAIAPLVVDAQAGQRAPVHGFNTRPFRPVPKK